MASSIRTSSAGVAAVGWVVDGVPVAELVAAVAVAGLSPQAQAGDGFGQRRVAKGAYGDLRGGG
jgi:hypothetical protein